MNNLTPYKAVRKPAVTSWDWTRTVDDFLAHVAGLSERDIEERYGFSDSTINRWRRLREAGEPIPAPRGANRMRLVRFTKRWPEDEKGFSRREDEQEAEEAGGAPSDQEELFAAIGQRLFTRDHLYQTLTSLGGPGEAKEKKLFLINMLHAVADQLRRDGIMPPMSVLADAYRDVTNDDI